MRIICVSGANFILLGSLGPVGIGFAFHGINLLGLSGLSGFSGLFGPDEIGSLWSSFSHSTG